MEPAGAREKQWGFQVQVSSLLPTYGVSAFGGSFHPSVLLSESGSKMYTWVPPCLRPPHFSQPTVCCFREGLPQIGNGGASNIGIWRLPGSLCVLWAACLLAGFNIRGMPL